MDLLLITDRPVEGRRLQKVVDAVEPCTLVGPGHGADTPPERGLIICDAALNDPTAVAAIAAWIARHRAGSAVPVLLLARGKAYTREQADRIGASVVLPAGVSDTQLLFTAKRMVASRAPKDRASIGVDDIVRSGLRDACASYDRLFAAARDGRPLAVAELERGGDALIEVVKQSRIEVWLDVVRSYDDVTYQHCLLVSGLATGLAIQLGMTLGGQRLVAQAALVHDIGKAGIPRAVLQKAGRLTSLEMDVMRAHAGLGHAMLARQGGFDQRLLDIVRHHHEHLDGSGYPDGLRGTQVPPLVRLVTVCDIYAALIERRSYKQPVSPDDALAILTGMGSKLDAGLLRTFAPMTARCS